MFAAALFLQTRSVSSQAVERAVVIDAAALQLHDGMLEEGMVGPDGVPDEALYKGAEPAAAWQAILPLSVFLRFHVPCSALFFTNCAGRAQGCG